MKKIVRNYLLAWVVMVVLFNVIVFVSPSELAGFEKFSGAFWGPYVAMMLAFVGQLACAMVAFRADNLQKLFYNLPLITVSYSGLVLTLVAGGICMAIPDLPNWAGIIACAIVLAFTATAVIKAQTAAEVIESVDQTIKVQTDFARTMIAQAKSLSSYAKSEDVKAAVEKVYEALRYSEIRSTNTAAEIEIAITDKFGEFSNAVKNSDAEKATAAMDALLPMIEERNALIKAR